MRASPDSFSNTRRKPGAAATDPPVLSCDWTLTASSAREREPLELEHLGAGLLQRLADGLRGVVDPLLVDEHVRAEEPLVEHALDDLLAGLRRLRLDFV